MLKRNLLFLLLGLAVSAGAASTFLISQIRGDTASVTGSVAVTTPNTSKAAWAKLSAGCSIANGVFGCAGSTSPTLATEIPAGTINGTNTVFNLLNTPIANSQLLVWNGQALFPGAGDYTISGPTITMTNPPQVGDTLIAMYQH